MALIMIPTPLRKFTGNRSTLESNAATVDAAITHLIAAYPALQQHILDSDKRIRSFVRIYIGDTDYAELQGASTPVDTASVISIVPAIAGGLSSQNLG